MNYAEYYYITFDLWNVYSARTYKAVQFSSLHLSSYDISPLRRFKDKQDALRWIFSIVWISLTKYEAYEYLWLNMKKKPH